MITKTIAVSQMATVLGWSLTAVRECIARDKFKFAQCWKTEGKKGRTFSIDKDGFRHYLSNTLGWTDSKIDKEFKEARMLFSAAKDISKEDMEETVKYIEFLKSKHK